MGTRYGELESNPRLELKSTQIANPYHKSCLDPWCGGIACKLFSDNLTFTAGIQKFLTILPYASKIYNGNRQIDPSELRGTIVLPLLSQDGTFNPSHRNWNDFSTFIEGVLSPIIATYSIKPNTPAYEKSKTCNTEALEICYSQSISSRQKLLGIPLSDDALKVNCWSYVRIKANFPPMSYQCCTPGAGIKYGPWVSIITFGNWQGEGGMVRIRRGNDFNTDISLDGSRAPELIPGRMLNLPQEYMVKNDPITCDGKVRYQLEFFMPELPGKKSSV